MIIRNGILRTMMASAIAVGIAGGSAVALDGPVSIVYDQYKVPTIVATTEHDAIFLQGYHHAKYRLFQMDFQRRLFSGRVSELVGAAGVPQDVQLRTLGLRRAAERSLPVQTPESLAWLQAYADGVNAFLQSAEPLPIEYGAIEITRAGIPLWTPTDSLTMAKGLAFGLSFDLGDTNRTLALLNYRGVCTVVGCNGLQLYNDDLWRVAPFESGLSIPSPPLFVPDPSPPEIPPDEQLPSYMTDPSFYDLVASYRDQISDIPILKKALEPDTEAAGSNWWVLSGANTESGFPMLSNDPHLSLGAPATFYEVHLIVNGVMNVTGVSFPGTPGVVIGCNETVCWGATVNSQDVTDVFNEVLLAQIPGQPTTPTATLFEGNPEPLQFIPQVFMVNVIGDAVPNNQANANVPAGSGGVTIVVPRRNNGPIVQTTYNPASATPLTGLSVAYTGWSATQEVETLRRFARAASMADFKEALQFFDVGSQNWSYADVNGNIAYYTSGELPIRQDLQTQLFPAGLIHPGIIRDGTNTNKHQWLPTVNPQPHQALSTEILPFSEMPQVENPPSGYIINANNDPIGTTLDNNTWNQYRLGFNGVLYLSAGYASGERLGRIQRLFATTLNGGNTMSVAESAAIQANNQLLDAEVLTPYLLTAFANATAPGAPPELTAIVADPRIADAIARLGSWDFRTPTGIQQGFDPLDNPLALPPPTPADVNASVAATIYSTWRGQMVQRVIDGTLATLPTLSNFPPGSDQAMSGLRRLLDTYQTTGGVGASLVNFFRVPGVVDTDLARDIILLQSLQNGLNLLASNTFAAAFNNSTNLDDYRWGKLHRIVFSHFLGGPFNIPATGSPLNLAPNLPGISRSGGRGAVDASSHDARADGLNEFMFNSGPARRVIATMAPGGCPNVLEVIPGGESGIPGSPNGTDQLFLWLVNAYKPLPVCLNDVLANGVQTIDIVCGNGVVDQFETCDDGNTANGDCCSSTCQLDPSGTTCSDGNACTTDDACSAAGVCVGGEAPNCDDGNVCTDDSCDTESGCVNLNNTAPCDDGSSCTSGDICQSGVCVGETVRPMPKTKGHYKKMCHRNELTEEEAACVAATAPLTFGDIDTVAEVCDEIDGHDSDLPGHDSDEKHCTKDETELLVLALNVCTGRLCTEQPIESDGGGSSTVQDAIDTADQIFGDPERTKDTCHAGKDLVKEINNGKAIRMDTLRLAKAGNAGVLLQWSPPFIGDDQSISRYEVWRSTRGGDAFVMIYSGQSTSFIDEVDGDFEYEVLVEIHD